MALDISDPYQLPYPTPDDLADVPSDIKNLVIALRRELNKKLQQADMTATGGTKGTDTLYQSKVIVRTVAPAGMESTFHEGDIIFVVV